MVRLSPTDCSQKDPYDNGNSNLGHVKEISKSAVFGYSRYMVKGSMGCSCRRERVLEEALCSSSMCPLCAMFMVAHIILFEVRISTSLNPACCSVVEPAPSCIQYVNPEKLRRSSGHVNSLSQSCK